MPAFDPNEIVTFWREAGHEKWFRGGKGFDDECRKRFEAMHLAAARRELDGWIDEAQPALGLVLLLDQIPRNIYRGSGHAFATDGVALVMAGRAIDAGHDKLIEPALRSFFYLPYEHSENAADQDRAVELAEELGDSSFLDYAQRHREVIRQFGRFPHRNAALGRANTPEEQAWLDAGGGF